jgi:hypothetical protein
MRLDPMTERRVSIDVVGVSTAASPPFQHAGRLEIGQDLGDRTLGYSHFVGEIADTEVAVFRERDEDVRVVTEERPARARFHVLHLKVNPRLSCNTRIKIHVSANTVFSYMHHFSR